MDVLTALLNSLYQDAPVRSVLIGAHWTVVCSLHCGMAAALTSADTDRKTLVREAGHLHRKSARELAAYAESTDPLEASIGVAAINSMLDVDGFHMQEINASGVLIERGRGRNIALVGRFPFVQQLRDAARQLWVIEQHPCEGEFPSEAAAELFPQAEMIAITSSALINHTVDGLLSLCPPGAMVMLLGPSTPLTPLLFEHGVDILSGARVVDEAAVLRTVGQGVSFRQVEGVKLLTFTRDAERE
jgi:hypothetical protein